MIDISTNGKPLFGIAGYPPNFNKSIYKKKRENIFEWIASIGLDWIELQNTYGFKMKEEQAALYKELATIHNIGISLHAPYYITLASLDSDIVKRSQERIRQGFNLAQQINSKRIIFHPGHFPGKSKADRKEALNKLIIKLNELQGEMPTDTIHIYPEIAGKKNQLGNLMDIIEICQRVKYARPCLDLAHLHAIEDGNLTTKEKIVEVFNTLEKYLGRELLADCHIHMYPVDINDKGEKKHKAFDDKKESSQLSFLEEYKESDWYYPRAEHFVEAIIEKEINPVVVCEARDTQDVGAILMKKEYADRMLLYNIS